jgi:hypothetical protein
MSLDSLKNRRNNIQSVVSELNKFKNVRKAKSDSVRFWSPKPDKQGNAQAQIRFLPALESDNLEVPFVKTWDHGFQGPTGKWYIENSLRTIDKTDPVAELNSKLWNSGIEANKEIARKRKQRLKYIGNIYVVKDALHPENEGKVFLYKFPPKVFEKIESAMIPPEGFDDEPIVPYDLWEGANLKLRVKKGDGGWPSYADSVFDNVSPLFKNKKGEADEAKMDEIYSQVSSLKPFIDPEGKDSDGEAYFKSYSELKDKLFRVLELSTSENSDAPTQSGSVKNRSNVSSKNYDAEDDENDAVVFDSTASSEDEDESLDYFASLVDKDE